MKKNWFFKKHRYLLSYAGKILRVMKLTTFLTILTSLQLLAVDNFAQTQRLSLNVSNESIQNVLEIIENETDYFFFYNSQGISLDKKVSLNLSEKSISDVLNSLFEGENISYTISNRQIILAGNEFQALQQRKVTGKVTDASGEPLPGVTVLVKGTTQGTVTDFDGNYTIADVSAGATLVFSFVGMRTQEVAVGGQETIDVTMAEDAIGIEEVVAVGYGVQKKVNLTGAISDVKADVLENRTTSSVTNMLTGNVAGVTIVQRSGQPGEDTGMLRVRGVGTLGNSEAMVVVDGVESSMNNVSPNDIESISVLKDAAASSIYGVRAANGVILITTKRGKAGKPTISYDSYTGWQQAIRLPDYLDSYNYATLLNEAYTNDKLPRLYSDSDLEKFKNGSEPDNYPNSNQLKTLLSENGFFHNHHFNVKGGMEAVKYSISLGYHDKKGLMPNTGFSKFNVRSNLDAKINEKLNVALNLSAIRSKTQSPASGVSNIMYHALRETPVTPIQFSDGRYSAFANNHNSVAESRESGITDKYNNNFQGSALLTYNILKGLSFRGVASTTFQLVDSYSFYKSLMLYSSNSSNPVKQYRNGVNNRDNKVLETNLQAYLDYDKAFGKHQVKGLAGYSQISNEYRILEASRKDLPLNNSLGEINVGDLTTQETAGNKIEYALRSLFGRINYSFDDRYLFEANLRYDGSSRFPKDNRFGLFPSFSVGWRVFEEDFFNASWVDNLKLRASWGLLGNQEIGNYAFFNTYVFDQNYSFGNTLFPGISIDGTMANNNISWEKSDQLDIGVDASFLKGMFSFTGDFFVKNTSDILLNLPIPAMVGVNPPTQNAGEVRNTGVELQLGYRNQIKDFKYFASFNLNYVHNEITSLRGGDTPGRSVGDPIYNIYGYVCEGIFQNQSEIDSHAKQVWGAKPGDLKYKDITGDGIVNTDDRKSLGTNFPKLNYGMRLGFEYKQFDFSALLQGAGMVKAIPRNEIVRAFFNGGKATSYHLDRWTPDNPDAAYPRLSLSGSSKNWMTSSFWAQNASYLKMRNVQVGYTLAKKIISGGGIDRLKFYFSVDNLFVITNFRDVDPEAPYGSYYPITRNYSLGVNLIF